MLLTTSDDYGTSLALGTSGHVYVTGYTFSSIFPTTTGAYDQFNYPFTTDVFVSKLNVNSSATSLLASTYLGGSGDDRGQSLTLDASGNIYVTGWTDSSNFPTTIGAYAPSRIGSSTDVFVSKLNGSATSLLASTYLGGSNSDDYGQSLTLDASGHVYVTGYTGYTSSGSFPTTIGAYDTIQNGGNDVFVSKLSVNGSATSLLASTYLGGSSDDIGKSLALDTSGNVYVTGSTGSSNFPIPIVGDVPYDYSPNGGSDVFVSKLNGSLANLLASTYLGGGGDDEGSSLALDTSGHVYVAGHTSSANFPTTGVEYDTSYNSSQDAFISKFDGNLSASTVTPTPTPTGTATATLTPTPTPTPQACVQPPSDMVAWWPMDETSGSVAKDIISGMNGAIQSNITVTFYTPGKVGGCFHYHDYSGPSVPYIGTVLVPHDPKLNFGTTGDFTIDAWIAFTPTLAKVVPQGVMIFQKIDVFNSGPGYQFKVTYNGWLHLRLLGGGGQVAELVSTAGPISFGDDGWAHVAVRVERNAGGTIFVNGQPIQSNSLGSTTNINIDNSEYAQIGWGGGFIDDMYLDEVEVFNRALTPQEIQDIYNAGSAGKCKPTPTPSTTTPSPTPTPGECSIDAPDSVCIGSDGTLTINNIVANNFPGNGAYTCQLVSDPFNPTSCPGWTSSFSNSPGSITVPNLNITTPCNYILRVSRGGCTAETDLVVESCDTCQSNVLNISTGFDHVNNTTYSIGSQDEFWTLVGAPTGSGAILGPAWVINNYSAWATAPTGSQWISAYQTSSYAVPANTGTTTLPYTFETSICVRECTDLTIDLNVLVDNQVWIYFVNGSSSASTLIGSLPTTTTDNFNVPPGPHQFGPLTIDDVEAGTHFIRAELRNDDEGSPMGLNIQGTVTASAQSLILQTCCGTGTSTGGSGVFGVVTDFDENILQGVKVTITGTDYSNSTETDDSGFYQFSDLAAGDYNLTYEKEGYEVWDESLSLGENEAKEVETIILDVVEKAIITGYVLDTKDNPIESVKVILKHVGPVKYDDMVTSTDEDGYFEFPDLDAGTYKITAQKKGYKSAKQKITLEEGEEAEVELVMEKTGKSKRIMKGSVR